jgi:hypothetical protein
LHLETNLDDRTRAQLQAFTGQGKAIAIAVSPERGVLVACSADSERDAGKIIKASLPRGGGSALLAQGTYTGPDQLTKVLAALEFSRGEE